MNVEVLVIGGGTAGCAAARSARKRGLSVALVESTRLGGECLWWTCLPTKALVVAADVYQNVRDGVAFGIDTDGYHLNYDAVRARKDALVAEFAQRTDADALSRESITVLHGRAAFNGPHEIIVREDTVHAEHIVLAVGAHPSMPPIPGLDTIKPLTYMRAMSLTKVPATLAIIGGGAVGCEFAQLFRRFGAEVSLIECGPRLLPGEDAASSDAAEKLLTAEGITVTTAATVTQAAMDNGQRVITMEHQGATVRVRADEVLVATGRRPRLDGLQLETAGLSLQPGNRLAVRDTLQTDCPHIWVCGDSAGGPQFKHVAEWQGIHVGTQIGAESPMPFYLPIFPHVTFLAPEIASVGLTEEQARQQTDVVIGWADLAECDRACISGQRLGFAKLVVERDTAHILGGHLVSPHAGELINEVALALVAGVPVHTMAAIPRAYPSFADPLRLAADDAARQCAVPVP